jgi:hypothetical protein
VNFKTWINTFVDESDLDLNACFEVEGDSGTNYFTYGVIIEHMLIATSQEQSQIKDTIVKIDFCNGDVLHFLRHLGQAIAR